MPQRFQRSRRKGARLPPEAVVVTRPTKWGNDDVERELRGRDLACYCPLDEPCHADVLLEIANG